MKRFLIVSCAAAMVAGTFGLLGATSNPAWSREELKTLSTLALASLERLPPDPSNKYADDPAAAKFGRALFFDETLSSNGKVSCAKCHLPERDFQDDTPLARGVGVTGRRTMPIAGTAHSPWLFWDGRMDSQWSQALGPLESPVEHGGNRTQYARYIAAYYRRDYERVFGPLPELSGHGAVTRVYANMGKAIAAFERTITFGETRFDRYVATELAGKPHTRDDSLTTDEVAGLRLFIGKANCVNCHNGARLTDDHFHNTGIPVSPLVPARDSGRAVGVRQVKAGEFNCLSQYSDAKPPQCAELRFAVTEGEELVRAYKTPSLRNVADRAPFMHAGQLATLTQVIDHYARAPKAPFGRTEIKRVRLSDKERRQLEAFLRTLSAPPVIASTSTRAH